MSKSHHRPFAVALSAALGMLVLAPFVHAEP